MNYESYRIFRIWAYTVSHCFLLIRSTQLFEGIEGYSKDTNYNVDIEFWGVGYLDLPDMLNGISIKEAQEIVPEKFRKYPSSMGYKIFEIKSEGSIFYVVAGGCRIGKNKWDTENRVLDPNLEYDEIVAKS
jgi:hypothetical protein